MTDIDGTAEEVGAEVAVVEHQPTTLFRTDDPVEVLERATQVAGALKNVIDKQGLITSIRGREHVRVEGWTTLGSMLGVVPVVAWTRRIEGGWEARVEARTLDGRMIGAAEAMCTKAEGKPWNERPDYALRSMAQTRATSKALRGPLGFVVTLAGYDATPAEEMGSDSGQQEPGSDVMTQATFDTFNQAYINSECKNEVLLAKMDEVGVAASDGPEETPAGQLVQRVRKMTGTQARDITAWLRESTS